MVIMYMPIPTEAAFEVWLQYAKWFQRRRSMKMVDGRTPDERRTDAEPLLYYKLGALCSGELIKP